MLQSRIKSIKYAINGVVLAFGTELNFKIHLFLGTIAICLGWFFNLSKTDWLILVITTTMVLVVELLNTAIEYLCDHIHPQHHQNIAKVKDVAAGAVLVTTFGALVIAIIIFGPHLTHVLIGGN